jgi:hypothetical protein
VRENEDESKYDYPKYGRWETNIPLRHRSTGGPRRAVPYLVQRTNIEYNTKRGLAMIDLDEGKKIMGMRKSVPEMIASVFYWCILVILLFWMLVAALCFIGSAGYLAAKIIIWIFGGVPCASTI